MDPTLIRLHEEATKFKTIERIVIGRNECEVWYKSPYPLSHQGIKTLHICGFCLSFYVTEKELKQHCEGCPLTCPPGDEVYRDTY